MDLIALLREFGADADLIALAERWANRAEADATPLTDDEVSGLLSGLIALGEDDAAGVGLIGAAADVAVDLRGEQSARAEALAAEEAQIEADRARLRGDEPAAEGDPAEGDQPAEGEPAPADAPAEGEPESDPAPDGGEGAPVVPADAPADAEGVPVTASGQRASLAALARRRPRAAAPAVPDGRPGAELIFAADVPNVPAGQRVPANRANLSRVSEAMERRFEAFRYSRGDGAGGVQMLPVATLAANYPEERRLIDDDGQFLSSSQMQRRVGAILEREATPQAITAAGGLCAPLQPYYGVETIGDTDRPVRDEALVSFQAARGGIISMAPPILPNVAGAVGVWTMTDDVTASSDASHTKAIIDVECGTLRETTIRAITTRMRFGNVIARTYGEWVQGWSDLALVATARTAETRLLADIKAGSTVTTLNTTHVEAVRDTLNVLNRAAEGMRSRHRAFETPFRVILPETWLAIAVESLSKGIPGMSIDDNLAITLGRILSWFSARNLNVTFSPDMSIIGPQGATALAALPPSIEFAIYPEGTWLHLDAGTLDLGVVRDTTTNAVNNFETFTETFEAAHKLGVESVWGSLNVCPSGAVVGTLDPSGICASYT